MRKHRRQRGRFIPAEYRPSVGKWELWALVVMTGVPVLIALILQVTR